MPICLTLSVKFRKIKDRFLEKANSWHVRESLKMPQETGMMNELVQEIRELKQKRGAVILA
ncbi:MAG: hypothetical protein ACN4A7_06195, partial [Thermacetogeniaceae bacterium]